MVWWKLWRCDLENWWCDQNLDGVKQLFKSVNNILMVWTKLCLCDPENRWCDQNLDGVKQVFKSVINILMVWSKLWRCDLENWWCEQFFFGVIKCWWCDETIFRCEQTSIFWKLCDHTVWCDVFTCFFLMWVRTDAKYICPAMVCILTLDNAAMRSRPSRPPPPPGHRSPAFPHSHFTLGRRVRTWILISKSFSQVMCHIANAGSEQSTRNIFWESSSLKSGLLFDYWIR